MKQILKQSLILCTFLIVVCGLAYPLAVTGVSNVVFHKQANGSMITYNNREVASELLGQSFTDSRFFVGRVSSIGYNTYTTKAGSKPNLGISIAADGSTYTGVTSGSSNLAPTNQKLTSRIEQDMQRLGVQNSNRKGNGNSSKPEIPADLVTNSGSGLDPDISVEAAMLQLPRIEAATGIHIGALKAIVQRYTKKPTLGVFGEERVNFVKCNLELARQLNVK